MSLSWVIYFASLCDALEALFVMLTLASLGMVILCSVPPTSIKYMKIFGFSALFWLLAFIFMPSTNTVYMMIGANKVQQLSTTKEGQQIKQIIDLKLNGMINDLQNNSYGKK